jgi:hypothetical protein
VRRSTKDTRKPFLLRDDIGAKEWVTLIYEQSKLACQRFPRGLYEHVQRNRLQNSGIMWLQKIFGITNEDDSKICIGEVKGKHRDIMKPDLLKFEANGVAVGKDESLFLNFHQKDSSDSSSQYHTNATTQSRVGEEELGFMLYARTI